MAIAKLKLFFGCMLLCQAVIGVSAQNFEEYKRKTQEQFQAYKNETLEEFREYRDRVNAEYAEFMRRAWEEHEAKPAEPMPEMPEPPKPVVREPGREIEPVERPLPVGETLPPPVSKPLPRPEIPTGPAAPAGTGFEFMYYGTVCDVPFDDDLRFRLKGVSENSVADAWTSLSNDRSSALVASCLDWRDELFLCDWGYVRFVEKMTKAFYGDDLPNEACLMQMYILTQSGYKVRIARADKKLVLLLPSENHIWQYAYIPKDGHKYYIMDQDAKHKSYFMFDHEFPKEQMLSLQMEVVPMLDSADAEVRTFNSVRFADLSAAVSVNPNLMEFYRDYPLNNDWEIYARASLSDDVKSQLYPSLRKAIDGMSELEAAECLLNFVQTAFEYKTDTDQFGYEKPFFADELFGYPYCDCEDRSILFSVLVHDLLGLDAVLVTYPGHMAAAVSFNDDVRGSYFDVGGKRYVVCDPTYIGASVGEVMEQFADLSTTVIRVW